ncbi:DNA-binding protein [bacterium 0.1xD8-71]|nr:DNA-binding protein [bacterium 0.1xD8-71]
MKNQLFVTAGKVAQELGVSKSFTYKLVPQINEELEKGFITIAGCVSRKIYQEKYAYTILLVSQKNL